MARAEKLTYTGNRRNPRRTFPFAPARNLTERDIARLTDEQYALIVGGDDPIYHAPKAKAEKPADDEKPAGKDNKAPADKPAE